jgi:hypothetical protein
MVTAAKWYARSRKALLALSCVFLVHNSRTRQVTDIWRIQVLKLAHVAAKEFFRRTFSYFPDKVVCHLIVKQKNTYSLAGADSIVKGKMIIPIEGYLPSDLYYAAVPVIF